ncbi:MULTISPECIES: septum formation inhibitor Maf [unclassified Leeuwenhoekiella]|uniref:septum formation inhibitor Maf n=1 Tax=unclassified Leeuwenhoekiella TaxID=2615029 RepID=UPI000C623E64|nr:MULTISPECIES: septum formation inhibitor Maf [unclassified Leeuwenhoekiella]MAW93687.1 septum formation inhibitor Maf [Leeuwenhoekiella sp.]MBA83089.1 septum formation inhibitor Maf [Leeuwenhoekiella sp.]|tara:strand:- start:4286 stop:5179 length:894 start_codon:yes stop_codon:yes gene_type:complete
MQTKLLSFSYLAIFGLSVLLLSCKDQENFESVARAKPRDLSQEFKDYWYSGEAEITSYQLEQPRYGELRSGSAVLIFVTEDFLPKVQVKANAQNPDNIPVLKLNTTKNYLTGIYPYSIMNSAFLPLTTKNHAIKVTNSIQEWCGQMYTQLNNRGEYYVESHTYFEGEADQKFTLPRGTVEDEIWALLRVDPNELPSGEKKIIPSIEYLRLHHLELKPYKAICTLSNVSYSIAYPELNRTLTINFETAFPYAITGWTERFPSGNKEMTATASRIKSLKTPYWKQNAEKFVSLRDSLGL